jgi:hypothetical protein
MPTTLRLYLAEWLIGPHTCSLTNRGKTSEATIIEAGNAADHSARLSARDFSKQDNWQALREPHMALAGVGEGDGTAGNGSEGDGR